MPFMDLLSTYSRTVLRTLLGVLLGTYIPKRTFRVKTLPAIPRPDVQQLLSYPGQEQEETEADAAHEPAPVLTIEPPPPLHIAGCFPSNVYHNDPLTLWLSSSLIGALNGGQEPIQEVDSVLHSVLVLAAYLFVLAATTLYASRHRPARHGPGSNLAEPHVYLIGLPYAPTPWERVLYNHNPGVKTIGCWDAYGVDFYAAKLSDDIEALIGESTSSSMETPDEGQRYAAWIDPEKLDAFTSWMVRLGFTDLRTSVEDISPPDEHPDAMLVDFRFSAKDASKEIITKIIMRFVMLSDVPKDRTDFIFWDLGEGWFRAFEVSSFEMAVIPVDEPESQKHFAEENLSYMASLPFYEPLEESITGGSAKQVAAIAKASSSRPTPLVIDAASTSSSLRSASATIPDLDEFSDLNSPFAGSPSWLVGAFPSSDKRPSDPFSSMMDDLTASASFVIVSEGQEAANSITPVTKLIPERSTDNAKADKTPTEEVHLDVSPAVTGKPQADGRAARECVLGPLVDECIPVPANALSVTGSPETERPSFEPNEPAEVDLTNSLDCASDSVPTVAPLVMDESWTEHLSEFVCEQPQETDLGAMNDGDFVDVTAELEPEVHYQTEHASGEPVEELQFPTIEEAQSVISTSQSAVVDIFRIIEETHATTEALATPVDKIADATKADDAEADAHAAAAVENVQSLLDVFDEESSFGEAGAEPYVVHNEPATEETVLGPLADANVCAKAAGPTAEEVDAEASMQSTQDMEFADETLERAEPEEAAEVNDTTEPAVNGCIRFIASAVNVVSPIESMAEVAGVHEEAKNALATDYIGFGPSVLDLPDEAEAKVTSPDHVVKGASEIEHTEDENPGIPEPKITLEDSEEMADDTVEVPEIEAVASQLESVVLDAATWVDTRTGTVEEGAPVARKEPAEATVPIIETEEVDFSFDRKRALDAPAVDPELDVALDEVDDPKRAASEAHVALPAAQDVVREGESVVDPFADILATNEDTALAHGEIDPATTPLPHDLDNGLTVLGEPAITAIDPANVPLPESRDEDLALPLRSVSPTIEDPALMGDFNASIRAFNEPVNVTQSVSGEAAEYIGSEDMGAPSPTGIEVPIEEASEIPVSSMETSLDTLLDAAVNSVWSLPPPETAEEAAAPETEVKKNKEASDA